MIEVLIPVSLSKLTHTSGMHLRVVGLQRGRVFCVRGRGGVRWLQGKVESWVRRAESLPTLLNSHSVWVTRLVSVSQSAAI